MLKPGGDYPVIIFGASILGKVIHRICQKSGIKVECFCDDKDKGGHFDGLGVIHTSVLRSTYEEAVFLLASANIKDMIDRLADLGYHKWQPCDELLKSFSLLEADLPDFSYSPDYLEHLVSSCILAHEYYLNPDKLFIRNVDLIITERCSLRCRDCSNLIQYFARPVDKELGLVLRSIDQFCRYIDSAHEFRLIGGEPFMNNDFHLIVERLVVEDKVQKIAVFSNGTILPKESHMQALTNEKAYLYLTSYGKLSRNIGRIIEECDRRKISYHLNEAESWISCSGLTQHGRTADDNLKVFRACCAKNLLTLADGRLFRCPFAANAHTLKAVPDAPDDYLDIFALSDDVHAGKNSIRQYLFEKEGLATCDFCDGRPYGAPGIPPAVQADKPLPYKQCC